jgi:LmbE family N-acetylglucosaminyl deacetylase
MLDLLLNFKAKRPLRVMCIGAHCDDIEIGCGATLRRLQRRDGGVKVDWVVMSGTAARRKETQSALRQLLSPDVRGRFRFGGFTDGHFPGEYRAIKSFFESLKRGPAPDLIFCHERDDRHQDHRLVSEMVWSTFRNHMVLEFEVPKWDGGLGQPNVYVPVGESDASDKVQALLESYLSQSAKDWFTRDAFMALLRLRGLECRSPSGYAEAFHGRKICFLGE